MVEGPAGPQRTAWNAAETALTLVAAALARKAVARFLTDEAARRQPAATAGTAPMPGEKAKPRRERDRVGPADHGEPVRTEYTGWSGR